MTPTPEQLKAVFENSMQYEIVYTFGVPDNSPFDYCQWEMINFSRLAHARVLYGFFETSLGDRRNDDVLAEDFGFSARKLLNDEDRERLNKDLFHFSYKRLRHNASTKPWPDRIISNLLEPTLDFMRHIRDSRRELLAEENIKAGWLRLLECLESGCELQIAAFTLSNHLAYIFHEGESLPNGKPALTRHVALVTQ